MATNWKRLLEPFGSEDIEWRVQSCGEKNGQIWAMVLAYVTARAIQARLDEVFGPGGWKNEYRNGPDGGVLCRIYFRNDEGEWVWRGDGAENTDIEAVKGGISGALKRAGSALGIGRYLYNLTEGFAVVKDSGAHRGRTKDGKSFRWDPPSLPKWALPGGAPSNPAPAPSYDRPTIPSLDPSDTLIPFGDKKGQKLGVLEDGELQKLIDWCTAKGKFDDLRKAAVELLEQRSIGVAA